MVEYDFGRERFWLIPKKKGSKKGCMDNETRKISRVPELHPGVPRNVMIYAFEFWFVSKDVMFSHSIGAPMERSFEVTENYGEVILKGSLFHNSGEMCVFSLLFHAVPCFLASIIFWWGQLAVYTNQQNQQNHPTSCWPKHSKTEHALDPSL